MGLTERSNTLGKSVTLEERKRRDEKKKKGNRACCCLDFALARNFRRWMGQERMDSPLFPSLSAVPL